MRRKDIDIRRRRIEYTFHHIDRNSFDFTGVLAGAFPIHNSAVRAHLGALAAFHTFGFVDMRLMFIVKGNRTAFANVLTPVSQAAPAGISDLVAHSRAVITGDVDFIETAFYTQGYEDDIRIYKELGGGAVYDDRDACRRSA